jgi:hypothetical protein
VKTVEWLNNLRLILKYQCLGISGSAAGRGFFISTGGTTLAANPSKSLANSYDGKHIRAGYIFLKAVRVKISTPSDSLYHNRYVLCKLASG